MSVRQAAGFGNEKWAAEPRPFRRRRGWATITGETGPRQRLQEPSMRIDFFGLAFETSQVTFHLWSPWRAAALEHRLYEAVRHLPRVQGEEDADEWRLRVSDPKTWRAALQAVTRVLK